MEWGDPGEALRAKAELAMQHAHQVRAAAHEQRERAAALRGLERAAVEAARAHFQPDAEFLHCGLCDAVWRTDAVAESMRRRPSCLLCGGPLGPVP